MTLYYAAGGGWGHFVRARAVLHTLGLAGAATIVCSQPPSLESGRISVRVPPTSATDDRAAHRRWLAELLAELKPARLFLDAFPAGVMNEWADFELPENLELAHVARLLRADVLPAHFRNDRPRFGISYLVEPLPAIHRELLAGRSDELQPIELLDPPSAAPPPSPPPAPFWLVVHSGPAPEVEELLGYAADLRATERSDAMLVLVSPNSPASLPTHTLSLGAIDAAALFAGAARLFGGGGFNFVRQTRHLRHKTHYLPFDRRHDDQYERVARLRGIRPT